MRQRAAAVLALVVGIAHIPTASAQTVQSGAASLPDAESVSNDDANAANNPLTPKATVYIQNYFIPDITDADGRSANQALLRGVMPSDAFGLPQLLRFKLSAETVPVFPTGSDSGLGDLTLYDLFLLPYKPVNIGIGPLLVAPTATQENTGDGKWQAGLAAIVALTNSTGLLSGLVTYQHSFAGDDSRPPVEVVTAQPIITRNIGAGFYLRSSGIWSFNLEDQTKVIPVGLGLGRIWTFGQGNTINAYVEPQYSVLHSGAGVAIWQVYAGVNVQFALGPD
jgi:hypothetical protein